jgi:putative ABC transport system permease protein
MRPISRLTSYARRIFQRHEIDRDLDAEIHSALALLTDQKAARGMSPEEARRAAVIELGGVEQVKENVRAVRAGAWLDSLFQDIRFALRMLRKNPGFTATVVLILAIGIGANTAVFGLVDSAFLRGLPFREPQRLVHIWTIEADGDVHTPTPIEYQAVRENGKSFGEVAAVGWADYFYAPDGLVSQDLPGLLVTANWFPTLGVEPVLGRNFREEEQIAGQDSVVMLSYDFWHSQFHADPLIIGRRITLNHRPVTVIGVLPQSLEPYYQLQIFAPLVLDSYAKQGDTRAGKIRVQIVARLKPGVTLAQARSEADVIAGQLKESATAADRNDRLFVQNFRETLKPGPTEQNARAGLWMTMVASGLVLLIACANVASLLLARGVKRQREVAVRSALGCSRGRMIRQLLTESTLLFLCGGAAAITATRWCEDIITKVASGIVPGMYLHVGARVFSVSVVVSLLSALAFGMIPALQSTRRNLSDDLKDGGRTAAGGTHSRTLRNYMVASQVALGMVLLVSFGLLLRSVLHVQSSQLGYDPSNVLTATVRLPAARLMVPSDRVRLMRDAVDRVRLMPGVESVGIADSLPMQGADSAQLKIQVPNAAPVEDEIWFVSVGPEYFSTLKVPMLAGRTFREPDSQDGSPVAIINRTFAKHYFPGTNPIGYHVAFVDSRSVSSGIAWREIVGVVSDFRQRNPEEDLRPLAYFPVAQTLPNPWSMAIRVRAAREMGNVAARINSSLQPMDPQLYWEMSTMQAQIHDSESLTLRRPLITLLACFGSLALILVIVSVFGVTSYSVAERTREIGIRAALGATPGTIAKLIFRESLAVAGAGLAVGTLCACGVARFFPTEGIGWSGSGIFLYGVSRTDPSTYVSAAILLTCVVVVASWAPVRRATGVDPVSAMRCE